MHILFLSHYFLPEVNAPANRTFEHARRWVADGHQVTVITGVPNHPRGMLFPGYRNRWLQEEQMDGIRVIRTWMSSVRRTPRGRARSTISFFFTALFASLRVSAGRRQRDDTTVLLRRRRAPRCAHQTPLVRAGGSRPLARLHHQPARPR